MNDEMSNQLSWQSAFWGIAGLAVNTMFQEAGFFEDLSELQRYVFRASPVACLADILLIIGRLISLMQYHRPLESLRILAFLRYRTNETFESSKTMAGLVKGIIFFVVALLQAVKLLACTGIPWTQASTVVYLTLYLLEGFLRRILATTQPEVLRELCTLDHSNEQWRKIALVTGATVIPLQAYFWALEMFEVLPRGIEEWSESISLASSIRQRLLYIALTFLASSTLILISCLLLTPLALVLGEVFGSSLQKFLHFVHRRALIPEFVLSGFANRSLPLMYFGIMLYWSGFPVSPATLRAGLAFLVLLVSFSMCFLLFWSLPITRVPKILGLHDSTKPTLENCILLSLLCLHLLVSVLTYRFVYDPQSTFRPGWTGYFG